MVRNVHKIRGQPQGIAPTKNHGSCRGNPLWLPYLFHARSLMAFNWTINMSKQFITDCSR